MINQDNSAINIIKVHPQYIIDHRNKWLELVDSSNANFLYSTMEWLNSYWETYINKYYSYVIIAFDSKSGMWLGALPITIIKTGYLDLYATMLYQTTVEYSDYLAPIVRKSYEGVIISCFLDYLLAEANNNQIIKFANIPSDDPCSFKIEEYLISSNLFFKKELSGCPVLKFNGLNYKEIFKTFKKSHRTDIKRQIKRLNSLGDLELKRITKNNELERHLENFFLMYRNRWKEYGQSDPMGNNLNKIFIKNLIRYFIGSKLHFSGVFLEGKPISYHIGFLFNNCFFYYKPTFDVEYSNYSPGKIHIALLIKKGCDENWKLFDFLQGFEEYKLDWANHTNNTISFIIAKRNSMMYKWQTGNKETYSKIFGKLYRRSKLIKQNILDKRR